MIHHFIADPDAADALTQAIALTGREGAVHVLHDRLDLGFLKRPEGMSFSKYRALFFQQISGQEREIGDQERVLEVSTRLNQREADEVWIWLAPAANDMVQYYWLLHNLRKHSGRIQVVNLVHLPFLNEEGKIFYPTALSQILPRELVKAHKVARYVTPSEMETDGEEWEKMAEENSAVRLYTGGKSVKGYPADYEDEKLLGYCSGQYQKAARIVQQTIAKGKSTAGETFLGWRLRTMLAAGTLEAKGETDKTLREFDLKLAAVPAETAAPQG